MKYLTYIFIITALIGVNGCKNEQVVKKAQLDTQPETIPVFAQQRP